MQKTIYSTILLIFILLLQLTYQQNNLKFQPSTSIPTLSPTSSSSPLSQTQSATQTQSKPQPQPQQPITQQSQITKNHELYLQPLINRYVIAVTINGHEQLFGIKNKNEQDSWVFIDEGADNHQVCFDRVRKQQLTYAIDEDKQKQNQQNNMDQNQQIEDKKDRCLDVSPIKCTGACKFVHEVPASQVHKNIQSTGKYSVALKTKTTTLEKLFLSASKYTVTQLKQTDDNGQLLELIYLNNQQVIDFFVTITGQINIADFQYLILSHHKQDNQYYLGLMNNFTQFQQPNQNNLIYLDNKPNSKQAITTKIGNNKQLQKIQVEFTTAYNSTQLSLGLPQPIYTELKKQIFVNIFQNKCQQITNTIFLCPVNKFKELQATNIAFCLQNKQNNGNNNKCVNVNLSHLMVSWTNDENQINPNEKRQYQYFFKVTNLDVNDQVILFPQFAALYNILIKSGSVYALAPHENPQLKINKNKDTDHDHHEHAEQQAKQNLGRNQAIQIIKLVSSQTGPLKNIFIGLVLAILVIIGCVYLYKCLNKERQAELNGKEWEQGNLIQEQTSRTRKKIFVDMTEKDQKDQKEDQDNLVKVQNTLFDRTEQNEGSQNK